MLNRLIRLALVSVFATAVAGYGVAYADGHEGGGDGGDDKADTSGGDGDSGDSGDGDSGDSGDGDGDGGGDAAGGDAGGGDAAAAGKAPGMILPKGKLAVNAGINVNLSADAVAKPIAIVPDVKYGVAPKLDVGLYHSPMGINGFWVGNGGGLCISGEENGCAKAFNGPTGILANYGLGEGKLSLAANGGLVFMSLSDPMMLSLKAGVNGRYMVNDKMAVHFNPAIFVGLTERDFNKETLWLPVSVGYAVSPKLHAGVQTGIAGPLDGFGDAFIIPLNIGAMFALNDKMGVAGAFGFSNIAGKNSSADGRALSLMFMWHN